MNLRVPPRLIAPLVACGIAGSAAVVGGACLPVTSSNPPQLRTGLYVLASPNGHALPGIITDSAGRKLRVIADTLSFDIASLTYQQHATVAITPAGGTEQAPVPFIVSRRSFTMSGSQAFVLPSTLYGGVLLGTVSSSSSVMLQMPDLSAWRYDYR